jgi:hypothetical protein
MYKSNKIMIIFFLILMTLIVFCAATSRAHESEVFKHGEMGQCYGLDRQSADIYTCYVNKERTICKELILSHDQWHVSAEYNCITITKQQD